MGTLLQDFRYAFRVMAKNRGFTAVAVITLALGIGANTATFSLVKTLLAIPFAVDDPNKAIFVWTQNAESPVPFQQNPASMDDFMDWRDQSKSFETLVAVIGRNYNFVGTGEPEQVQASSVSTGFMRAMGQRPLIGRTFLEGEDAPGAGNVAMLTHTFWQQEFGGSPDVLNSEIVLDGEKYTVVGVGPENFNFPPGNVTLWTPLQLERGRTPRDLRNLFIVGRLREGVTIPEADAEIKTITKRLEEEYGDTNQGWSARVQTMQDTFISGSTLAFSVLYGAITFVLLIACANIANLLLSRATVREKEIALRTALGARRTRIIRQLLTESIALGVIGGALGLLVGFWGIEFLRGIIAANPNFAPLADGIVVDTTLLAHTLVISIVAGLIFGLAPALQGSKPDLQATLKEGGRGSGSGSSRRLLRSALVVVQVALSLALLSTAGLFVRAFQEVNRVDLGFKTEDILTMQINLPEKTYRDDAEVAAFYRQAVGRLAAIPGVKSASSATVLPMTLFFQVANNRVNIEGVVDPKESTVPNIVSITVTPSYFRAFNVALLEGRLLSEEDNADSLPTAVINQKLAERYFPDASPVGKRIKLGARSSDNPWLTIVGVVENLRSNGASLRASNEIYPHVILPQEQNPARNSSLVLHTQSDPSGYARAVQEAIWEIDSTLAPANLLTHKEVLEQTQFGNALLIQIVAALSIVAMLLAGVGIYGVISYAVNQRVHEIGIRMALGAKRASIILLVIRQGALLTLAGLSLGLLGAYAMASQLAGALQGFSATAATGPVTYLMMSGILLAVAILASAVPARRATRVDPMVTLRYE